MLPTAKEPRARQLNHGIPNVVVGTKWVQPGGTMQCSFGSATTQPLIGLGRASMDEVKDRFVVAVLFPVAYWGSLALAVQHDPGFYNVTPMMGAC